MINAKRLKKNKNGDSAAAASNDLETNVEKDKLEEVLDSNNDEIG